MNDILKENIVRTLHLDTLPADEQEAALENIGKVIYERVMLRVLDELSEKDKDELDALLGRTGADGDAIATFLQSRIPKLESVVNDEIAKFKTTTADFTKNVAG